MNPNDLQQLMALLQARQQMQPQGAPPMPPAPMSNGMPPGTQFSAGKPAPYGPRSAEPIMQDPLRMAQLAMGGLSAGGAGIGMGARAGIANAGRQGVGDMLRQLKDPAELMFGQGRVPLMGGAAGGINMAGQNRQAAELAMLEEQRRQNAGRPGAMVPNPMAGQSAAMGQPQVPADLATLMKIIQLKQQMGQ